MIIPMTDIERKLTEDHLSIVAKVIQTLTCGCRYVSYDERQDLLQIGNLALCKAAMNYDGNRPFETYAKVVIRNAIYDYWRSLQKERTYTCSMDAIADNETDTSYQQLLADTSSLQNWEQEHNLRSIYEYLQTLQNVNCTTIKREYRHYCFSKTAIPVRKFPNIMEFRQVMSEHGRVKPANTCNKMPPCIPCYPEGRRCHVDTIYCRRNLTI